MKDHLNSLEWKPFEKKTSFRPDNVVRWYRETGRVRLDKTTVQCKENTCKTEGGCATCADIVVGLPEDADGPDEIEVFTNAGPEHGSDLPNPIKVAPGEVDSWFFIGQPEVSSPTDEDKRQYVKVRMYNRSHDRNRLGSVRVYFYRVGGDSDQDSKGILTMDL
jgi:hypothetical protein